MDLVITFTITFAVVAAIGAGLYFAKPYLQGQRTRLMATLMGILGVLTTADVAFLPDNIEGPIIFGASILMVLLRQWTTTPAGEKE